MNFYARGGTTGGLVGCKSKAKIPEFFVLAALGSSEDAVLPTSTSAYAKWCDGIRNPDTGMWEAILNADSEDSFLDKVKEKLNVSQLALTARKFEVSVPKNSGVDKDAFAFAIVKQFYALAQGNGEAENIVPSMYRPGLKLFPVYEERASEKFSKVEIPFTESEERLLDEVYVCNSLTSRQGAFTGHSRGAVKVIENATLDSIREYSNKVTLVSYGGMGKSMMLRHLFMDSIVRHQETGNLPVLIELRQYSFKKRPFLEYVTEAVNRFDATFTEATAVKILERGKCQLLLDGIDEIDPLDKNEFQTALTSFVDRYPNNQYVLASRECEMLKAATGFYKLYLQPFDEKMTKKLISNLLNLPEEEQTKNELIAYLQDAFLSKHTVFATNPMLLTFIVNNHPISESFNGKQSLFYRGVYTAIVTGHDKAKIAYDRIFQSTKDADEFTNVFRIFCRMTYIDKVHEFKELSIEDYLKKIRKEIKDQDIVENPKLLKKESFIHDACATACMMFEQSSSILYIDRGFQEYLFAEYLYLASEEEVVDIGYTFWDQPEKMFGSSAAFEMFYELSADKVEKCFFLPYLTKIFKGQTNDSAFLNFLKFGYQTLTYNVLKSELVSDISTSLNVEWVPLKVCIMEPTNIIHSQIFRVLDLEETFCGGAQERKLDYEQFRSATYVGEKYFDTADQRWKLTARRIIGDKKSFALSNDMNQFITDKGELVILGYEYNVDFSSVAEAPEKFSDLISVLKTGYENLWSAFSKVKDYYDSLSKKYKKRLY